MIIIILLALSPPFFCYDAKNQYWWRQLRSASISIECVFFSWNETDLLFQSSTVHNKCEQNISNVAFSAESFFMITCYDLFYCYHSAVCSAENIGIIRHIWKYQRRHHLKSWIRIWHLKKAREIKPSVALTSAVAWNWLTPSKNDTWLCCASHRNRNEKQSPPKTITTAKQILRIVSHSVWHFIAQSVMLIHSKAEKKSLYLILHFKPCQRFARNHHHKMFAISSLARFKFKYAKQ